MNLLAIKQKPLLYVAEAEESGRIKGILVDGKMHKVHFLLFVEKAFGTAFRRAVSLKKVMGCGDAAVAVQNRAAPVDADDLRDNGFVLLAQGAKIFDDNGNLLGRVADVQFEGDGKIDAILSETASFSADNVASVSDGIVVIGKKPIRPKTSKKVSKKHAESQTVSVHSSPSETCYVPKRLLSDNSFLAGRICTQDVLDFDGRVIIKKGSEITDPVVELARKNFRLVDLTLCSEAAD